MVKFSVIVPCKKIDKYCEKCIQEVIKQSFDDFELLVLPDSGNRKFKDKRIKVIETGKVLPSVKRNLGMKKARGEFFAFIDSDAYPKRSWLENSLKYLKNKKIGIVGGPNLTPNEGNFAEHVSGYVLGNFFVSGPASVRYKIAKNQFVRELPSCNYISRKEISPKFDSDFLTAEDSKFCFDVAEKGYKILYAGDVIVYHHRRNSFWKHLKQMFIYGRDIGWLTKKEFSSDKLFFMLLSLFSVGFIAGFIASFFSRFIRFWFFTFVVAYFFVMLFSSLHKNLKTTGFVTMMGIMTHFAYGFGWLYAMFFRQK